MRFPLISEDIAVKINLGLLVTIICFIIAGSFTVGRVLTKFDDRLETVEVSEALHAELIEENKTRNNEVNVRLARIETDTNWIRTTLERMLENE